MGWAGVVVMMAADQVVVIVKYRKLRKGEGNDVCDDDIDLTLTVQEEKRPPLYRRLTDPHYWSYRYIILFIVCYILFSMFYCLESPGGLEDAIIKVMEVDTTQYSLLFSVSAWPSVILCLIGGPLNDRVLSRRPSIVLLAITITIGQIIWALGAFVKTFWVMVIGRFLIGAGFHVLTAVFRSCVVFWFKNKHLAFALSVGVTLARLGGAAGLSFPQLIYGHLDVITNNHTRLGVTIIMGAVMMVIGLILMILLVAMDKYGERILQRDEQKVTAKIKCSELKQFSLRFWLVAFISTIYYSVVFSFTNLGEVFYVKKYGLSLASSGIVVSFVFSATLILTPLIGLLVDMIGYHVIWVMCGLTTALIAHLMILVSGGHNSIPYISGVIYSISYTVMSASLWTLPALLIDSSQITTAYSLILSPYMLLLATLTLISGTIVDNAGYFILETSYILLLSMSLLAVLLLWLTDSVSTKSVINLPGKLTNKIKRKVDILMRQVNCCRWESNNLQ